MKKICALLILAAIGLAAHPSPAASTRVTLPFPDQELNDFLAAKGLVFDRSWARAVNAFQDYFKAYPAGRYGDEAGYWLAKSLDALAGEKRRGADLRAKDVLRTALKQAPAFLEALVTRTSSLGYDVARLLQLLERYGARELDAALEEAMAKGAISVPSVAHLLDGKARSRKQPPPLDVVVPESVRHVRVTPHALADYDSLSKKDGES